MSAEKDFLAATPVVIDNGTGTSKVGFAGERGKMNADRK
jgi:actin-related protein